MSYKHDKRAKNIRREREFPERFKAGVATGSWSHYEQTLNTDAGKQPARFGISGDFTGSL